MRRYQARVRSAVSRVIHDPLRSKSARMSRGLGLDSYGIIDADYDIPGPVTVYQAEPLTEDTGLLDADGNPIYAVEGPEPVGFHLDQWRMK